MKSRYAVPLIPTLIAATFLTCSDAPLVVQGTVIQYNAADKTLVVKDEQSPNPEVTLLLADADMGTEPQPGETVRVSYRRDPQGLTGIRVMNLSHQMK
jgi:hypothetical protein